MTRRLLVLGAIACLTLAGCGPTEPIRLGFIGGLSDRNSDNGQSGQNGVILAIEQFNRAGGLGGRQVELVVRDDAQEPAVAERVARELVAAGVEAVIGPFTSGMAQVIVPITRGRLDLGPWQQVFYYEFDGRRPKRLVLKAMGE